jgi:hypothetical protein
MVPQLLLNYEDTRRRCKDVTMQGRELGEAVRKVGVEGN